ncbi:MAG TPA: hypothetical protein VIY48_06735 [Candidatus Paceibacterota bacterium]
MTYRVRTAHVEPEIAELLATSKRLRSACREMRSALLDYWAAYIGKVGQPLDHASKEYLTVLLNLNIVLGNVHDKALKDSVELHKRLELPPLEIDTIEKPSHLGYFVYLRFRQRGKPHIVHLLKREGDGWVSTFCGLTFRNEEAAIGTVRPHDGHGHPYKTCKSCEHIRGGHHEKRDPGKE